MEPMESMDPSIGFMCAREWCILICWNEQADILQDMKGSYEPEVLIIAAHAYFYARVGSASA